MAKLSKDTIERQAYDLVISEVNQWQDAVAFVTKDVAFNMRRVIENLRRNYYGIFKKPADSTTGRKKTWIPLTESTVDAVRKNIDIDTKDINFRAKHHGAIGLTEFTRDLVRAKLDQMFFGLLLDNLILNTAIDGIGVWKTYVTTENGKKTVKVKNVDLLNVYIDATAPSIQEATIIERAAMTVGEIQSMDGWRNTEDMMATAEVSRNERNLSGTVDVDLVDVYERWGLMPKSFITGKSEDEEEMIQGHIVVSGIDSATSFSSESGSANIRVHLLEENTDLDSDGCPKKPYEELWYNKVPGRWYGRGPAEQLLDLQRWLNVIVNIRINRSYVTQLGIFKVKKNSGVTRQMVSGLAANGVIPLNNMDDFQQIPLQDASPASYQDEQVINNWAQKATSTFDVATGENLPASTPATNAVIQSRASQSQFVLVKEQIGMFLQRWLKRQYLPALGETLRKEELAFLTGESEELKKIDERIANKLVSDKVQEMVANGEVVDPEVVKAERDRVFEKLQAQGPERFVKKLKDYKLSDFDVQVFITNEEIDKAVLAQNLVSMLQTVPQLPDSDLDPTAIAESIFDLMGVGGRQFRRERPIAAQQVQAAAPAPAGAGTPLEQAVVQEANLPV